MNLTARQADAISKAMVELQDIAERAEHECDIAKRAGNKIGNYGPIARAARRAMRALSLAQR